MDTEIDRESEKEIATERQRGGERKREMQIDSNERDIKRLNNYVFERERKRNKERVREALKDWTTVCL